MKILSKLFTLSKAVATEAATAVTDSQALRILDQEMLEAKDQIKASEKSLAEVMARRKLIQDELEKFVKQKLLYEAHAKECMLKGEKDLALDCTAKSLDIKKHITSNELVEAEFLRAEDKLRASITTAKLKISALEHRVSIIKATESVQKAQTFASLGNLSADSKLKDVFESIDRIEEKQALKKAQLEAEAEIEETTNGGGLDAKLKAAGVTEKETSLEEELERIMSENQ